MIGTLSRSLRVRDDGTGKGREINGTLAEFESEHAIILLGDPGMGKTTLFKETAKENYTTVRNFLIDPQVVADGPLFLDALDEFRTIASGQDASSEVARALCSLKKPKFRLSCRAADWFGSTDQEALRVASASGRMVVLELCPLTRDEILNAVQGIVRSPAVFLEEVDSAGLGKLLGNPQTLELLARAWGSNKKPRNKFEAYEIGISELIKETNPQHIPRSVISPDPIDLRRAAGAAASTILLSNSVGISRSEPADISGYVRLPVVPYPNRNDLDAVLKRRIFISTAVDLFAPIHRTIAGFLAAEDLSERIMRGFPIDRVLALICGFDGRPVSSLRGLFAWLMCKLGHIAEIYVAHDLWEVLPAAVWPVPKSDFFLARTEKEIDPERAADLFRMYLSWFPEEGASVAHAEAGFDLLDRRRDVAKVIGNWRRCKIEKWRRDQWLRTKKEIRNQSVRRAQNVAYCIPRLTTIRDGREERILAWASIVYIGLHFRVHRPSRIFIRMSSLYRSQSPLSVGSNSLCNPC